MAKDSVSTRSGKSRMGSAWTPLTKASLRRWIVSQRLSTFRSLSSGTTQSSATAAGLLVSPAGSTKPIQARRTSAGTLARSMRLKVLHRKFRGVGLTRSLMMDSTVNTTSKPVSRAAAANASGRGRSTVCMMGTTTEARITDCMRILYPRPVTVESGSSKMLWALDICFVSLRPCMVIFWRLERRRRSDAEDRPEEAVRKAGPPSGEDAAWNMLPDSTFDALDVTEAIAFERAPPLAPAEAGSPPPPEATEFPPLRCNSAWRSRCCASM
mmetsp:Transcript_89611/g.253994  ORF Transcript_89611/g.253994 Transcript_89611/m.253994 type:complete len:269 (+) Transcript_89611:628-1434(+)